VTERIVGVIGGMGAEATADFYWRLVDRTPASHDQDHLRVLIDSNAKIPDRTTSILAGSDATLEAIVETARGLEAMGADILAMPCNSAHYWYDRIIAELKVPLIHMIEEVYLAVEAANVGSVGLLATTGTVQAGIYEEAAGEIEVVLPGSVDQARIHDAIYGIKLTAEDQTAAALKVFREIIDGLVERGATGIVLGCTEIPLVVKPEHVDVPLFDSTEVLVEAVLREAFPRSKSGAYS
jgi:aspartate racemase